MREQLILSSRDGSFSLADRILPAKVQHAFLGVRLAYYPDSLFGFNSLSVEGRCLSFGSTLIFQAVAFSLIAY